MPFCPTCRFEYREGITHCPECGVDLVAELPPAEEAAPPPDPDTELVELIRMGDPSQAEVIQAALREAGIQTMLKTHGPITGRLASVVDGATHDQGIIYVTRNRLEEARQILEAVQTGPVEWPEGMEPTEAGEEDEDDDEGGGKGFLSLERG
jgi:hypothetical protein